MISSLGFSLIACLPLLGPVSGAGVQEPGPDQEREASALERWQRMSAERREVLRRRFEELRQLSPEERAALEERHRGVESMRARLRRGLSPEVRRELEQLAPEQRHVLMREELVEEARGRGARIRGKLPPEFERELEAAEPEQRAKLLEDFRRTQFERRGERHLNHLTEELGLTDAERERIAALPPRQHRRELSRLEKQRVVTEAEARGAPPNGIELTAWERLRQLPPEEFLDEMLKRGVLEGPPGGPRGPGRHGQASQAGEGSLAETARKRLRELLRPDVAERIELAELSRTERMRRMGERVSGRALDYLEHEGLVEPAELERLRGLSGHERVRALRELCRGRGPMRGGAGRERGERTPGARYPGGPGGPPQRGGPGGPGRPERPGDRFRGPHAGPPPLDAERGPGSRGEGRGEGRRERRGGDPDGRAGKQRPDASDRGGREPR